MDGVEQDNAGVVAPPPLLYIGSLVVGLLLQRAFPATLLPRNVARLLGLVLLGTATLLEAGFYRTMRQADTPINPWQPVRRIVVEGPFRFSRNPSYLSMALGYLGITSMANTPWPLLLLPGVLYVVQRGVIAREERYLERKFGEEYLHYKQNVRRWI